VNYRHAYHAGNFADVLKHVVLSRLIEYLKRKDKAFRVIDTHAGSGLYDLGADEASRTAEWRDGIGRLIDAQLPAPIAPLLRPYLDAVRAQNSRPELRYYPGSPLIARHLFRPQDRLSAIELHPQEAEQLNELFAGDFQVRVIELDGWLALGAHLPPKEKRGIVLVDPPFEKEGEFGRLVDGLVKAHRRWPTGVYALWYPIKDMAAVRRFREALSQTEIPKILDVWQTVCGAGSEGLIGSGVIVVNPNFELEGEMKLILPALASALKRDKRATFGLDWLAGEPRPA